MMTEEFLELPEALRLSAASTKRHMDSVMRGSKIERWAWDLDARTVNHERVMLSAEFLISNSNPLVERFTKNGKLEALIRPIGGRGSPAEVTVWLFLYGGIGVTLCVTLYSLPYQTDQLLTAEEFERKKP
jgi:hypothetical protein